MIKSTKTLITTIATNIKQNTHIEQIMYQLMIMFSIIAFCILIWFYYKHTRNKNKRHQTLPNVALNQSISSSIAYVPTTTINHNNNNNNNNNIDPNQPTAYPLRDYYILASYNTCVTGPYNNGTISIQSLRNALALGFRFLDFEIYSEEGSDNPIVACSTLNPSFGVYPIQTDNPLLFSEVMQHLTTYAFVNYGCMNFTDPLIINLRIKTTNTNIPTKLASIFQKYENFILGPKYSFNSNNTNFGQTLLPKLIKKISIFVESINDTYVQNKAFMEYVNMCNHLDYLSVKTWSEFKLNTISTEDSIRYNKQNMSIIIPDVDVINPVNKMIQGYQLVGCQIVCLMISQDNDAAFTESINMFNTNHSAFVLKPDHLRYIPEQITPPIPQLPKYSYKPRQIELPDSINLKLQI